MDAVKVVVELPANLVLNVAAHIKQLWLQRWVPTTTAINGGMAATGACKTQPLEQVEEDQSHHEISDSQDIDFVTLGMLIIDDIEFRPPRPPARNVLGGAGTFSALGARLFSPAPEDSRTVGWIVDRGSDFPAEVSTQIASWQTSALMRDDPSRLTTRGWNGYDDPSDPDRRSFRYATPKLRLQPSDLAAPCPALLRARAVHVISSPERCREVVRTLQDLRRHLMGNAYVRPLIVWEPVPDLCTADQLLPCTNTLPLVDVCSPNHAELAGLLGDSGPGAGLDDAGEIDAVAVEQGCEQLLASMPLNSYALVIRAGARGCYIARNGGRKKRGGSASEEKSAAKRARRKAAGAAGTLHGGLRPDTDMEALFAGLLQDDEGWFEREEIEVDPGVERWVPAFYTAQDADSGRIVDPTGGGNTFLGALAVAMARDVDLEEAALWGNVAASFALEQIGMPVLEVDAEGNEIWNGVRVEHRLEEYLARFG